MPKLISEGICLCFDKAIVQSMLKHVVSENGPLALILQSYSQIFIIKHIDSNLPNLVELIMDHQKLQNKFCFWPGDKAFRPVKKFYELRNFTNTNGKVCPKCSFFNLMNRQTRVKRKVAFLSSTVGLKSQNIVVTHPSTLLFVVAHPPKINELNTVVTATSDLDTPPQKKKTRIGTCTRACY